MHTALSKDAIALHQPCQARPYPAQASRDTEQLPACRQSPCTHINRSLECTPAPPRPGHCRADPRTAAPSRRYTQAHAAPFTSRADHQKPKRSMRDMCSLRLSAASPPVELCESPRPRYRCYAVHELLPKRFRKSLLFVSPKGMTWQTAPPTRARGCATLQNTQLNFTANATWVTRRAIGLGRKPICGVLGSGFRV